MNAVEKLREKENQIKTLQEKKSRLEGRKEQLLSDLKEKFKVTTLEAAQKLLEEKRTELTKVEDKVNGILNEMDEIIEGAVKNV